VIALPSAGVSDRVIASMMTKASISTPAKTVETRVGPSEPLFLHDGTPVRMRLSRNLSSADAKTGQLDNQAIIKMVSAGLSEDVVLAAVNSQPGSYSVNPDDLISLKQNKVPDNIIATMIRRRNEPGSPSEALPSLAEVGVYYGEAGSWIDFKPEVVNWKTGGVVKSVSSLGVVKRDVNGLVNGPSSPNILKTPLEVLIYTSEGVGATEYQLVRLHQHNNRREFRTVTGGVFHVSEGAMRDLVSFDSKKIAPRLYRITLTNLAAGEYGFLPPNNELQNRASASLGKMYTFRVSE
jgi:hypothetical protein